MHSSPQNPVAVFPREGYEYVFQDPVEIIGATRTEEVAGALARIQRAVDEGKYAAGYLAYEAAPAFDSALEVHPSTALPLLWFGIFTKRERHPVPGPPVLAQAPQRWEALVSSEGYKAALEIIREHIAAGNTYQVNFTYPLQTGFQGDALAWFRRLSAAQGGHYGAYLDTGRHRILSVSPELFFELDGSTLVSRPMKGTAPRGRWLEEDTAQAEQLRSSAKDRAENLMIVDMVRNDLGRIAHTSSIRVEDSFHVERYETLWQMTSTVRCETAATVPEIFGALFPCASITGAPKVQTMKIIRTLEPHPRGVYCGAIGWWGPERRACFNVAIRTVLLDTESGKAQYHVGGGITWDSTTEAEYDECRAKALVLNHYRPDFRLLESLRYEGGYFLLALHLKRLQESAAYWGFACDESIVRNAFDEAVERAATGGPLKVRLLLARDGTCEAHAGPAAPSTLVRLGIAISPVQRGNVFLYHKTTFRQAYEDALKSRPKCDDVLLWNESGEVTESAYANLVIEKDGRKLTPKRDCGLLAGAFREQLLHERIIEEAVLRKEDLLSADAIHLINSVRKWIPVDLDTSSLADSGV